MKAELIALKTGAITFDAFAVATRREWERLSGKLLSRWEAPEAVEREDLVQEMLIAAWRAVDQYDSAHPSDTAIERFVVFHAVDKAKKWLHTQRRAYRGSDKSVSRNHVPFESVDAIQLDHAMSVPPDQERLIACLQVFGLRLAACTTVRSSYALQALVRCGGSVPAAAAQLYGDPDVRRQCRFDSRANANQAVFREAKRVLRHVAA